MKKRKFADGGAIPDFSRLTFKEAFQAARGGPDAKKPLNDKFTWNGKTYTTELEKPKAKSKPAPDQSQAETNRLRRQDDAAGPSVSSLPEKPKRELPKVEYTDEMNDALLTAMGGAGLGRRLGKELARAGELRAEAAIREGNKALKEASQKSKYVRDFTKDKEPVLGFKKGGAVSASRRGDGIAQRGKTRGKLR